MKSTQQHSHAVPGFHVWPSVALSFGLLASACSGSSVTPDPPSQPVAQEPDQTPEVIAESTTTRRGFLMIGPAQGVRYRTASGSGTTGRNGEFEYQLGETVAFDIAGLKLGDVVAGPVVTASDLAGEDGDLALLRWMISLDHDGDPGNGIALNNERMSELAALLGGSAQFDNTTFYDSALADTARLLYPRDVADELAALHLSDCMSRLTPAIGRLIDCGSAARDAVPPLGVNGRNFVDQDGRHVLMQGLFAVWKLDGFPLPPDDRAGFTEEDADLFARLGFNSVRFAWFWSGIEPEQGVYDQAYLNRLDEITRWFGERGVFVIHDAHQDGYGVRYG